LKIEDRSRPKRRPDDSEKLPVGRFDEVVIFIEKDSQFQRVEMLADLLGFSVECGKGQQSTEKIESLVEYLEYGKKYLVFCITDYDHYGFEIFRSLEERANKLGLDADFVRIGINLEDIPEEEKKFKCYTLPIKTSKERDWNREFGWKGKFGFEIEALPAKQLRGRIADRIYDYCDVDSLYRWLLKRPLENFDEKINDIIWEFVYADKDVEALGDKLSSRKAEVDKELEKIRKEMEKKADIPELEKEKDEKIWDVLEKYKEKAKSIVIETIDEREIPKNWLKEQIVEGKTYLNHEEFTDIKDIEDKIREMLEYLE
jgi:hypothetical protein